MYILKKNNKIECPKCGYSFKLKTNKSICKCDSCLAISFLYFANYEEYSKKLVLLDNLDNINKNEFEKIDDFSIHKILYLSHFDEVNGFRLIGNCSRYKTYLIVEEYRNKLIPVYLCNYSNGDINYSIYSPVVYKNVYINLKNKSIIGDFPYTNSDYTAPTVYFNSDNTEYTVGYKDFNELYHSLSQMVEGDYPIIEK